MASRSCGRPAPVAAETHTWAGIAVRARHSDPRTLGGQIDLVEHRQLADLPGADAAQHLTHLLDPLVAHRIARIDDMQQQIGIARFLQGRAKGRDQLVRQSPDEADGVRQNHLAHARQFDPPHGRIERGEQLVRHIGRGAGERIEQRRLAGIGIADQSDGRDRNLAPHVAAGLALPGEFLEPRAQRADALRNEASVGFQLRLARAPQPDTALLPLEVGPSADQARRQVRELRELHLQLALKASRPLGKYVENQAITI